MFSLHPLALGKMISGAAEEMVVARTGVEEKIKDLGEEKTSRALNLALDKIDSQLLTLQALLTKEVERQQLMMRMIKNVKLSRMTWRSGRARVNGAFPLIHLLRIHSLDLQISLLKN